MFTGDAKRTNVEALESGGNVAFNKVIEASLLAGSVALGKQKADSLARMFTGDTKRTNVEALESGGNVAANKVVNSSVAALAIDTPEVAASAINEVASFVADGSISTTSGTEIEVGSVTITDVPDIVEIHGKLNLISSASSIARMRKGSVTGALIDQTTGATAVREASMTAEDTSPTDPQTYVITLQRQTGTNVGCNF